MVHFPDHPFVNFVLQRRWGSKDFSREEFDADFKQFNQRSTNFVTSPKRY